MIKRIKRKYTFIVMSSVILVLGLIITAINIANYTSINSLLDEKVKMLVDNEGLMPDLPFGEKPKEEENVGKDNNNSTENGTTEDGTGDGDENEPGDDNSDELIGSEDEGDDQISEDELDPDDVQQPGEGPDEPSGDGADLDGNQPSDGGTSSDDDDDKFYQHMSPETPFELRYFSVKLNTHGEVIAVDTSKIAAVDTSKAEKYAKEIFKNGKENGYFDSYKYMVGNTDDGNLIYVFLDADRELKSYRSFLISSLVITCLGIFTVLALVLLLSDTALRPIIESYEKQKRFITDAGHEMKTPLTVISANAEIIELETGESQWITGIKSQVSKLASLTEKLVILSKMEEGVKLEMNEFSLSEAFFDTCDQYKSIAISKNVRFDLSIAENVQITGNENEIRRCITLLLDNAFRYTNEGGFVSVKVQSLLHGVEMKFTNSTNGVDKESVENWFDRFYRTDLSRNSDTGGSGIGLSVVKAIVHAHGGVVRARSNDGVNVEFTINI